MFLKKEKKYVFFIDFVILGSHEQELNASSKYLFPQHGSDKIFWVSQTNDQGLIKFYSYCQNILSIKFQ